MKVLSVIIPSFNSEAYLEKCVDSLVSKDVIDKLDIIIVNDGSTDKTAIIADRYASVYPQSIRVVHQENKGHGGAVNTGCMQALGKYLRVLDADDTFVTANLKEYISALENANSDVVLTNYFTTDVSNGEIKKWMCYPLEFARHYTVSDVISHWNDFSRSICLHGITYLTDFYKKVDYGLSEKIFYEDHELSTFPFCFAESIMPLDIFIYNYRIGDASQSVSDQNRVSRMEDMVFVLQRFANEYKALPDNNAVREFVCQKVKVVLLSYLTTALMVMKNKKSGRNEARKMMEFIKHEIPRAFEISIKQYRVFRILNFLGIKKKTFDRFLESNLYHKLKGTRNFN